MLDRLTIVLCRPKYPENIGAAARACANMGCPNLIVVAPQRWDVEKSLPLATPPGAAVLARARVEDDLDSALAGFSMVFGTTARGGGWRRGILTPAMAAPGIHEAMAAEGGGAAVVFGSEDRGLTNEDVERCGQLLMIPTADSHSLNLAQAVLIVLYECLKSAPGKPFRPAGQPDSRLIDHAELSTLFRVLETTLLAIDYLKQDNIPYRMLPVRRFFQRFSLRRNEFNLLMGVCRRVLRLASWREMKTKVRPKARRPTRPIPPPLSDPRAAFGKRRNHCPPAATLSLSLTKYAERCL